MPSAQQTAKSDSKSDSLTNNQPQTPQTAGAILDPRLPGAIVPQARQNAKSLAPDDVLQLQRAGGNNAVGQLLDGGGSTPAASIQAKPGPGQVQREEEPQEEEEEVVQSKSEVLQRKCASCEEEEAVQTKPQPGRLQRLGHGIQRMVSGLGLAQRSAKPAARSASGQVQRRGVYTLPTVQRSNTNGGSAGVSSNVESSIESARGGGSPLPKDVRGSMEQSMGADFSGVRIHTGSQADSLNRSIQARAFTTGNDVFFRSGEYNPGSRGGKELLAHELTHTIQQGASNQVQPKKIQAKLTLGPVNDKYEQEADAVAKRVVNNDMQQGKPGANTGANTQSIQRKGGKWEGQNNPHTTQETTQHQNQTTQETETKSEDPEKTEAQADQAVDETKNKWQVFEDKTKQDVKNLKQESNSFCESVPEKTENFIAKATEILENASTWTRDKVVAGWTAAVNFIKPIVGPLAEKVKNAILMGTLNIRIGLHKIFEGIGTYAKGYWNKIKEKAKVIKEGMQETWQAFSGWMGKNVMPTVKKVGKAVGGLALKGIAAIRNQVAKWGWLKKGLDKVKSGVNWVGDKIGSVGKSISDWTTNKWKSLKKWVDKTFPGLSACLKIVGDFVAGKIDPMIDKMLSKALAPTEDGASKSITLSVKGGITLPGIELGIPASIKAVAAQSVSISKSDDTYTLVVTGDASAGLKLDQAKIEAGIKAGKTEYQANSGTSAEGSVGGKVKATYKFDSKEKGALTKMAAFLVALGFQPVLLSNPMTMHLGALLKSAADTMVKDYLTGVEISGYAKGSGDLTDSAGVSGSLSVGTGWSQNKDIREETAFMALGLGGSVSKAAAELSASIGGRVDLITKYNTKGKDERSQWEKIGTKLKVVASITGGGSLGVDQVFNTMKLPVTKEAIEAAKKAGVTAVAEKSGFTNKVSGNISRTYKITYTLDAPGESINKFLDGAEQDQPNWEVLAENSKIKVDVVNSATSTYGGKANLGAGTQTVGVEGAVSVSTGTSKTIWESGGGG